jgi:hypothetical protein
MLAEPEELVLLFEGTTYEGFAKHEHENANDDAEYDDTYTAHHTYFSRIPDSCASPNF